MANGNSGNQFNDYEINILDQLRDSKTGKTIFPKIGRRLNMGG